VLFHIAGGGPSGLYLAYLLKRSNGARTVRVFEQNPPDVTFGFGVVLSGRALQFLAEGSSEAIERLARRMERWSNQHIVHRGERVVIDGSSYAAIERLTLLRELHQLCAATGVELSFEHRATHAADLADCNVLVGADGANSAIRESHATEFGTRVHDYRNYFAWYGVERPFEAHTLTFKAANGGAFVGHHYRYKPAMSTFVAEVDAPTWEKCGMAAMTDDERRAYMETIFADTLAGKPLLSNRSIWRRSRRIDNDRWHVRNIGLIGDALRTAHPSIGSGTRLAMEDAIALWRAFESSNDDVSAALRAYERARGPIRKKLDTAMELSVTWYEQMASKMQLPPHAFAYDYLRRTNIMTADRLARESPDFMRRYRTQPEGIPAKSMHAGAVDSLEHDPEKWEPVFGKRSCSNNAAPSDPTRSLHPLSSAEVPMIRPLELHPKLHGVDHTARPTWRLRETVRFYRDILGLPLVHCISAKGWGREKEEHADFLHFFFDSGNASTIAFFYYIGTRQPPELVVPRGYMAMANHTAWRVQSETELLEWQRRLESHGVNVSQFVRHEIIESIYFRDPNWYPLEITRSLRDVEEPDAVDAAATIEAAMELEDTGRWKTIEQLWRHKVKFVQAQPEQAGAPA